MTGWTRWARKGGLVVVEDGGRRERRRGMIGGWRTASGLEGEGWNGYRRLGGNHVLLGAGKDRVPFREQEWHEAVKRLDIQRCWKIQRHAVPLALRFIPRQDVQIIVDLLLQNCDKVVAAQSTLEFVQRVEHAANALDRLQWEKWMGIALHCEEQQTLSAQDILEYATDQLRKKRVELDDQLVRKLIRSMAYQTDEGLQRRWLLIKNLHKIGAAELPILIETMSDHCHVGKSTLLFVLKDVLRSGLASDRGFVLLPYLRTLTDDEFHQLYADLRLELDKTSFISICEPLLISLAERGVVGDSALGLENLLLAGLDPAAETYDALASALFKDVKPDMADTIAYKRATDVLYRMIDRGHAPSLDLLRSNYQALLVILQNFPEYQPHWQQERERRIRSFLNTVLGCTEMPMRDAVIFTKFALLHGEVDLARNICVRYLGKLNWSRHTRLWTELLFKAARADRRHTYLNFTFDLLSRGLADGCQVPPKVWLSLVNNAIRDQEGGATWTFLRLFSDRADALTKPVVASIVSGCCAIGQSKTALDFISDLRRIFPQRSDPLISRGLLILLEQFLKEDDRVHAAQVLELMDQIEFKDAKIQQLLIRYKIKFSQKIDHRQFPIESCSNRTLLEALAGHLDRDGKDVPLALMYWQELVRRKARIDPAWVSRLIMATRSKQVRHLVSPAAIFKAWRGLPHPMRRDQMQGLCHVMIQAVLAYPRADRTVEALEVVKDLDFVSLEARTVLREAALDRVKRRQEVLRARMVKPPQVEHGPQNQPAKDAPLEEGEGVYASKNVHYDLSCNL